MIDAPRLNAPQRVAAQLHAPHRNSTRLWAAWNRYGGSGVPKGIKRVTALRTATRRGATPLAAPLRSATQLNATHSNL
jgi:hypothetical protein